MSVFDWMEKITLGLCGCPGWTGIEPRGVSFSCEGSGLGGAIILDGSAKPIARARFPVEPGTARLVMGEYQVLAALGEHCGRLATSAPIPLGLMNLDIGPVAYYPYIPGRTVNESDVAADDEFNRTVVTWLADMHSCLGRHRLLDVNVFEEWVSAPAWSAIAKTSADQSHREALEYGLEVAAGIVDESVPTGISHCDLWCDNALRNDDGSGFYAIDWSMAVMDGLPMFDLLYWHLFNMGLWNSVNMVGAAEMCIRSESVCGDRFREAVSSYCELLRWSPNQMASWLVAFIIHSYSVRAVRAGSDFMPTRCFRWLFELPKAAELGEELGRSLRADG